MPDPIDLPLDEDDPLTEPPLIGSLHYEKTEDGFSVIFVPSIAEELTQMIFVVRDSPEGRMISAYLYRIQALIGHSINKVFHRGGGDFTLHFSSGGSTALSKEGKGRRWAAEVFDRLKQIAELQKQHLQCCMRRLVKRIENVVR